MKHINHIHKRRIVLIAVIVLGSSIALGLILFALQHNINLFYTPTQMMSQPVGAKMVRVGGLVKAGSIQYTKNSQNTQSLKVEFIMTDNVHDLRVVHTGVLPDLFREKQGVVVLGRMDQGIFRADQVLAKHDEVYRPVKHV